MAEEHSSGLSESDRAQLGELFKRFGAQFLGIISRRLDPSIVVRVAPEDVFQEAFLEAHRRWKVYQQTKPVIEFVWLYRIVQDRILAAWRRHGEAKCGSVDQQMPWPERSSMQIGLGLVGNGTSPSDALVRDELCQRVRQVMGLLKATEREILLMRYADELSFQDIADVLGICAETANVRHFRAVRKLSKLWKDLYPKTGSRP